MNFVTFSTRYLLVFLNVIFWAEVAAEAQQPLPTPTVHAPKPDAVGELPPVHSLLHEPGSSAPKLVPPSTHLFSESIDTPYHSEYENHKPQYDLWDALPVAAYSSGTWLERGFWYAEADALILNRTYSRDSQVLGGQDIVQSPFGDLKLIDRVLQIREGRPGADGGVRLTLGRFLFRDQENRDHAAEFTVASAGDWSQYAASEPDDGQTLYSAPLTEPEFDGATEMDYSYTSRFNSFELNYRLKNRMRKDQMVLKPDGEWHRRASPTMTTDYLLGLRYFDLAERFRWGAKFGVGGAPVPLPYVGAGEYLITTDNRLFGFQMGTGHALETGRWSLSALAKGGVFVNSTTGFQRMTYTPNRAGFGFSYPQSENEMSFLGEFALRGRWHLRPNLSLRAAYEMMLVTSISIAPHQAHFSPVNSGFATTGESFFQGASFGLDGYW
jgi:hypothetical protein